MDTLPPRRLRRHLHTLAEPSGQEADTARFATRELARLRPAALLTGLGGHGVAAVFGAVAAGPTVLLRAELDAVPVPETVPLRHASRRPDVAHKCGHDGHQAILLLAARRLAARPPGAGRVVVLFQPAEENGAGAAAVIADPRFDALRPDWAFALHNLPGFATGRVLVRSGPFAAGSAGLRLNLRGRTTHAAVPRRGHAPETALGELVAALVTLPERHGHEEDRALVTVTHARLGEPGFGVAPGQAELLATLRADDEDVLARLRRHAAADVRRIARAHGLACALAWEEVFPVTGNDADAARLVRQAARAEGLPVATPRTSAFRWSEDFGHFARLGRGALFGLGAGRRHPGLHAPDYDFNDALLPLGAALMHRLARLSLQSPGGGTGSRR